MIFLLVLNHFSENNSSSVRYVSSFTGGVTPSLLLTCVALVGLLLLLFVVKHAFSEEMNFSVASQNLDEESCDESPSNAMTGSSGRIEKRPAF